MEAKRRDSQRERKVLTGMIVDSVVLARIATIWSPELFNNRWSNLIGSWCIKFHDNYGKAPGAEIESLYEQWANKHPSDKETASLIESYLDTLSREYEALAEESNSDYVIDLAAEHFNEVKLNKLQQDIKADLEEGQAHKAEERVSTFHKVEIGVGAGIDVLRDEQAIQAAFQAKTEPLIVYPGSLGEFFGDTFERDAFVAFMAPEKRGKTWWLLDVAWMGMEQRNKVAFFAVGDMSQNQMMRRLMTRAAQRPVKPKRVNWPIELTHIPGESADVEFKELNFKHSLDWATAAAAAREVTNKTKTHDTLLKLSCHPNSSIDVPGIETVLQGWEREGWTADVIVIDYADILKPPSGIRETRDQINWTWKKLRALSQQYHCCVVTATQSDSASYRVRTLSRSNFSDDKRKLAEVTAMIGINASEEEKERQLQRLNYVALREDEFLESRCVYVAGCLSLGRPVVKSTF